MKKRVLALVCTLALALGLCAVAVVNVRAEETTYQVGYSREDINPYVRHYLAEGETGIGEAFTDENGSTYYYWWTDADGNTCYEILPLPLRGLGTSLQRIAASDIADDNGDGVIDENDGLYVSCISVTDASGETVLLINVAIGSAYGSVVKDAKNAIVEATNGAVDADHIMITASGTYGSVDLGQYNTRIITTIVEDTDDSDVEGGIATVAEETDSTTETTPDEGTDDDDFIEVDAVYPLYNADGSDAGTITGAEVYANFEQWYPRLIQQITASAVNAMADGAGTAATMSKTAIDVSEATATESDTDGVVFNAVRHYTRTSPDGDVYVITDNSNIGGNIAGFSGYTKASAEANDTLSLLRFTFQDEGKTPVVLASWAYTASLNASSTSQTKYSISSDFLNCFSNALSENYRVAMFPSTTSNIAATSRVSKATTWIAAEDANEDGVFRGLELAGNVYGTALAAVAQVQLESTQGWEEAAVGNIQLADVTYNTDSKAWDDEIAYYAGLAMQTLYTISEDDSTYFPFIYPTHVENYAALYEAFTEEEKAKYAQFKESGETYIVASKYHGNDLVSNYLDDSYIETPVTVFFLGENVAFLTAPGELADRYSADIDWTAVMTAAAQEEDPQAYIYNTINSYNDWNKLLSSTLGGSYGTPFILGTCNANVGDIPSAYSYDYNTGSGSFALGCYEAQTTEISKGTGETLIDIYADLLKFLTTDGQDGDDHAIYGQCDICNAEVRWREMDQRFNNTVDMYGHYIMTGDATARQKDLNEQQTVCIDLNGHSFTGTTRCFHVYDDSVLNIMDTSEDESGVLQGMGGYIDQGLYGGTLYTTLYGTINMYGGTATAVISEGREVARGGIVSNRGTFNMYGGTITGGVAKVYGGNVYVNYTKVEDESGNVVYYGGVFNLYNGDIIGGTSGSGGNIFVQTASMLNVEGGNITGGTATATSRNGGTIYTYHDSNATANSGTVVKINGGTVGGGSASNGATIYMSPNTVLELSSGTVNAGKNTDSCIYTRGSILLTGDIDVARIHLSTDERANLTIKGAYTGKAQLRYAQALTTGCDIGNSDNADFSNAELTIYGDVYAPLVNGSDIIASYICNPSIVNSEGEVTQYNTLDYALLAYQGAGETIVLNEDSQAAITYDGDVEVDLNGCNLSGEYAMATGNVHYVDSQTTDYSVADDNYGRITGANAEKIATQDGVVLTSDGYLMVSEDDGVSFHKLDTSIDSLYFRSEKAGIYYGATFKGDEVIKKYIDTFGVAVSIEELPVADANGKFAEHTLYSAFTGTDDFQPGNEGEFTSTVLINIISEEYGTIINKKNSSTGVHARSYIKLTDGTYIYSGGCQYSLEWVVEYTDKYLWNTDYMTDARKAAVLELYAKFPAVFNAWDIPNIKEAAE